jgi:hypothetical protein
MEGLMSVTELEEVQALLERVLPDPRGFAGRLLQQAMTQYGQFAPPAAAAYYAAATAEDAVPGDGLIVTDEWADDQAPADINLLLAAALGACECWGQSARCDLCQGYGSAGWTEPDPDLFDEYVRPAVDRLPGDRENHQPVKGEKL